MTAQARGFYCFVCDTAREPSYYISVGPIRGEDFAATHYSNTTMKQVMTADKLVGGRYQMSHSLGDLLCAVLAGHHNYLPTDDVRHVQSMDGWNGRFVAQHSKITRIHIRSTNNNSVSTLHCAVLVRRTMARTSCCLFREKVQRKPQKYARKPLVC